MTFDQNGYNDMPEEEREALDAHEEHQRALDNSAADKRSRIWGSQPRESSLPHIIVDSRGERVRPVAGFPPFPNRTQATRVLNILQKRPSPFIKGDPRTWRVVPFVVE